MTCFDTDTACVGAGVGSPGANEGDAEGEGVGAPADNDGSNVGTTTEGRSVGELVGDVDEGSWVEGEKEGETDGD